MVPCSLLTFDAMMTSAMNALTDVDVVRGITSFVALRIVVLALITTYISQVSFAADVAYKGSSCASFSLHCRRPGTLSWGGSTRAYDAS